MVFKTSVAQRPRGLALRKPFTLTWAFPHGKIDSGNCFSGGRDHGGFGLISCQIPLKAHSSNDGVFRFCYVLKDPDDADGDTRSVTHLSGDASSWLGLNTFLSQPSSFPNFFSQAKARQPVSTMNEALEREQHFCFHFHWSCSFFRSLPFFFTIELVIAFPPSCRSPKTWWAGQVVLPRRAFRVSLLLVPIPAVRPRILFLLRGRFPRERQASFPTLYHVASTLVRS